MFVLDVTIVNVAQEPQQLRNGDRDQPGVQVCAGLLLRWTATAVTFPERSVRSVLICG